MLPAPALIHLYPNGFYSFQADICSTMKLIEATYRHIPAIRGIVDITWPAAYGAILSGAQIAYMIECFYSEAALKQQMESGHRFFLVMQDDEPLGFAGFELNVEPGTAKLHKLYVLPGAQGTGAGKKLLNQVEVKVREANQHRIILNVNRYNKAVDFYGKAGFEIFKEEDIDIGRGYFMNDYVMEKELK